MEKTNAREQNVCLSLARFFIDCYGQPRVNDARIERPNWKNCRYMTLNLPEKVANEICAFAREHKITKVVLFGSRARGTNRERSDVDLAVVEGDFDAFYWDVQERVDSLLSFDVVHFASASDELKKEIERDGITLYEET